MNSRKEFGAILMALCAIITLVCPTAGASPITVSAGDVVSLSFGTVPGNWDPADPPDYLSFGLNAYANAWIGEQQPVTVSLYDGDRLLYSHTGIGIGATIYGTGLEGPRQPTGYEQYADLTSVLDGTIRGRFDVSFTSGAFVFDPATLATCNYCPVYTGPHPLMLFDMTPNGGFWVAQGDFDWVRDVKIGVRQAETLTPVPEPGTLSLLATGLGVLAANARKRRIARRGECPGSLPAQAWRGSGANKMPEPYLPLPPTAIASQGGV